MAIMEIARTLAAKDGRVAPLRSRRCARLSVLSRRLPRRRSGAGARCRAAPPPVAAALCLSPDDRAAAAAAGLLRKLQHTVGAGEAEASLSEVAERFVARQRALCSPPLAAWLYADGLAENGSLALPDSGAASPQAQTPGKRHLRVSFDPVEPAATHEVTAYSEVYGLHPREFVFGRGFEVIPSGDVHGFTDFLASQTPAGSYSAELIDDGEGISGGDSDEEFEVIEWW